MDSRFGAAKCQIIARMIEGRLGGGCVAFILASSVLMRPR